jgi:large conductance mechanosensitive channel
MWKEFREFILRGNVLELAIAFVMGVAFTGVVTSFTDDILMALIAAAVGRPDFSELAFELNDTPIKYGLFLTALVNFLLVALALFLVMKAVNAARRPKKKAPVESDHDVLVQIRDSLQRSTPTPAAR